jgi:carbon storage regulator
MLVLSRYKNESIIIGNDIVVTLVEIRGDKVRLGIVAPKNVPVHREEVYEAIHGKSPRAVKIDADADLTRLADDGNPNSTEAA